MQTGNILRKIRYTPLWRAGESEPMGDGDLCPVGFRGKVPGLSGHRVRGKASLKMMILLCFTH